MPKGKVVESETLHSGDPMARPYVLKPVNEGSSVGVAIVTNEGNYGNPIGRDVEGPWKHFDHLLAEPFIKGHELTVAVIGGEALCVTELKPKVGFYDYDSKYTDGLTEHVCPAQVPEDIARSMMDMRLQSSFSDTRLLSILSSLGGKHIRNVVILSLIRATKTSDNRVNGGVPI